MKYYIECKSYDEYEDEYQPQVFGPFDSFFEALEYSENLERETTLGGQKLYINTYIGRKED